MADDATREHACGPCPTCSACSGWPACPLFLWLVLGPEADGWALGAARCSPGSPTGSTATSPAGSNQTSKLGADPRPGRRPALHPRRRGRPRAARHHPVVGGGHPAAARRCCCGAWCRSCAPAATARCRCTSSARPRPFNLLYAFPLLLLGDGDRRRRHAGQGVRLGVRDLGDRALLVGRAALRLAGPQAAARPPSARTGGARMPEPPRRTEPATLPARRSRCRC